MKRAASLPQHLSLVVDQHDLNMVFIVQFQGTPKRRFIDIQSDGAFSGSGVGNTPAHAFIDKEMASGLMRWMVG